MSAPNSNTIDVGEFQVGIEADLIKVSGGRSEPLGEYAKELYKATGDQFARTVESSQDEYEYSRERAVAHGLESLGALATGEEVALHRIALAKLVRCTASLAVACHVDLPDAFGYIFPSGSFDGTMNQFDDMALSLPEANDLIVPGPFGWSIARTIAEDTVGTYTRAHSEFMDTAERALKMQRPPRAEALTRTTGRLFHAVSWILQERLDSSLVTAMRLEQNT